ncbi:hypothetical protein V565_247480 [Rhizoctonia solani 123E]|uniref:Uncharacterized protein n=1 Tax=Rhizoctonia solani 123E TaxID=1423351 RepID=A0A074RG34_9AGAM|nr:hypothetical protein V565_247480 [Rhizoctonia solani 123E]
MAKLSAVEFALCVLSMFGCVMDENRMALQVLLKAIKSYNPTTGKFGKRAVKQAGYGGRSSLRAMAGAQAVLHTILDPVIGCLSVHELVKLREDMDAAMQLASSLPMEEVRVRVAEFAQKARENGGRERWMRVWEKAIEAQAIEATHQPSSVSEEVSGTEDWKFAVVPIMSTLKRRAHAPRNCRPAAFPSPVDVCLGRGSTLSSSSSSVLPSPSSGEWYRDTARVWHPHGWKMFYPATAANRKRASPAGFKFPPPGMISATTSTPAVTPNPVDSKHALEMSAKLKQWQDDWETEQLGSWKAAIDKDAALEFIVDRTRDEKIWHAHGWKKFCPTTRRARKETSFQFPAPESSWNSATTSGVDSERPQDKDMKSAYKMWEDMWEAEQLGRWTARLTMPAKEGGMWNRLAMAWKSEEVDAFAGMVEGSVDGVEWTMRTTLAARVGRLFGLA